MAASIECCIHIFSDENGPILPISKKMLQTIKNSVEKWRQLIMQIMRMVSLQELLIKTVREVENLDDSVEIRGFYLNKN